MTQTHWHRDPPHQVLLMVEARPGKTNTSRLTMTDDAVIIDGKSFAWPEIDRVRCNTMDVHVNGAYQGTQFNIAVAGPRGQASFRFVSGTTRYLSAIPDQERRDLCYAQWSQAGEILDAKVLGRLTADALTRVRRGGSATIAGVRIDGRGLRKGGLLAKTMTWPEVAGTEFQYRELLVLARRGARTKPHIRVWAERWNVPVLVRAIAALTPAG